MILRRSPRTSAPILAAVLVGAILLAGGCGSGSSGFDCTESPAGAPTPEATPGMGRPAEGCPSEDEPDPRLSTVPDRRGTIDERPLIGV
jgi:hypothetical protein